MTTSDLGGESVELRAILSPSSPGPLYDDENEKLTLNPSPRILSAEASFASENRENGPFAPPDPENSCLIRSIDGSYLESSANASVWVLYNEETTKSDMAMQDASNRSIDVLLVFTGLFSAVLTTFIIQAYQLLIPGPLDATNQLLVAYITSQAVALNMTASQLLIPGMGQTETAPTLFEIRWVNGLWFAALAFSLSAALFCMLAKQWLQFAPNISGSPRHRARQRQRRYMQFQAWHVMTVIHALPTLLHATLLLFFAGLIVLLWSGSVPITVVTFVIVALVYACYFGSMWLSLLYPDCPYQHPITEQLRFWLDRQKSSPSEISENESQTGYNPFKEDEPDIIPNYVNPDDLLDASALVWLLEKCPTGNITSATLQAIASLPRSFTAFHVLRKAGAISLVLKEFRACFHRDSTLDSQWYVMQPQDAEKYCRAWMRLTYGTSKKWPSDYLILLETLNNAQIDDNVSAIATCIRAVAYSDSRDGRAAILTYLAKYAAGKSDFSLEIQYWLLDTFLQCSIVSRLHFRPKDHIAKEAVPMLLRLLHLTKHALASNARSAIALALSYMTGNTEDPKLFSDEETRRLQFYNLIIPSLTVIVENPSTFAVDEPLLNMIADEFSRLASLALTPTATNAADRRMLKPIAQRGLLKLYVEGRITRAPDNILADVISILYPPVTLKKEQHLPFVKALLNSLQSSTQPRTLVVSALRLLEPILSYSNPAIVDIFIEGKGLRTLLRAAQTGDTSSRRLQLDCMRTLCLFIGSTADHHNNWESRLSSSSRLDHIFQSDFFPALLPIVSARRWWLPEIAEIWVPALLKLCRLRPHDPIWKAVEAIFRKFANINEGKDGYHQLIMDLDDMKAFIVRPPDYRSLSGNHSTNS